MNKKIMKAVLAIAIVFCFAAMPMYGMVRANESAVGVVRNVAPTKNVDMTGDKAIVYNSGSDSITFNAAVIDRNREDDIGADGATPSGCWWNISSASTGDYTNKTVIISSTPTLSEAESAPNGVNLYNATDNDGILAISDDDSAAGYAFTCPVTWAIGTDYWSNLTITDSAGNRLDFTAFQFEVKAAVKIIGIYNYTGLLVDLDSPFFWNFTTTDPGVFNVTSGNWSYTGTTDAATNYGYNNNTGRLWSFWLVVNNTGGTVGQCFNVSFADEFTSALKPGTTIPTKNAIRFEYNRTSVLTWANNATSPDAAKPSAVEGTYVKDGDGGAGDTANDGKYMFQFDAASQNIWIRFMIDIPAVCRASTDYTCAYAMIAG